MLLHNSKLRFLITLFSTKQLDKMWWGIFLIKHRDNMHTVCTDYRSVFQPFWCSGTLHKCDDHSQNPMQWFPAA